VKTKPKKSKEVIMKISKVWALAIVLTVGLFTASVHAQGLTDGILVNFDREVVIKDKTIPAGEYEIRKVTNSASPVIRIFNRDEMMYETPVIPIAIEKRDVVEDPKVVIHRVGDKYYLTEIWIQPDRLGYEVPLPSRVRALEKEIQKAEGR
jgi:hypothetical protein